MTQRDPVLAPKKSGRRRNGETRGRQFVKAAKKLTRAPRGTTAMLWLADTLDWLNLWQPGAGDELTAEPAAERSNNHLSPRL